MKILCLTGTRPEIIRLSVIIKKLQEYADAGLIEFIHVYSNQNFDANLSTIFFEQLNIKPPINLKNYWTPFLDRENFIESSKVAFKTCLNSEEPDKVLILGDTNSCLLAEEAAKMNIPVYHMEAGSRCYDNTLPEERNRKIIDNFSTFNLPYTENAKQILISEGFNRNAIIKTGNPIKEVLYENEFSINSSEIIRKLGLQNKAYFLLTMHRSNIVDNRKKVYDVLTAIFALSEIAPVIFPMHPRTADQLSKHSLTFEKKAIVMQPLGLFDFVKLEKNASCVITDSGTVPEECAIFGVPCISLRDTTERHELLEAGSMILAGTNTDEILRAYKSLRVTNHFTCPVDYDIMNVSQIVVNLLMGIDNVHRK